MTVQQQEFPGQLGMFDAAEGERRATEAITRADTAAPRGWKATALLAVELVARHHLSFTTDDVWAQLHEWMDDPTPPEPRAMGAIIRKAVRLDLIAPTDGYRKSERPEAHSNPKRVWQSKIHESYRRV